MAVGSFEGKSVHVHNLKGPRKLFDGKQLLGGPAARWAAPLNDAGPEVQEKGSNTLQRQFPVFQEQLLERSNEWALGSGQESDDKSSLETARDATPSEQGKGVGLTRRDYGQREESTVMGTCLKI